MLPLFVLVPAIVLGGVCKVGQFTKTTASAPVMQVVPHGLGTSPRALLLWGAGRTVPSVIGPGLQLTYGMTDGTTSFSVSSASTSGVAVSNASSRVANALFSSVAPGEVLRAEASLAGWDATTFTLAWSVSDGSAELINFIAVGGADVQARVVPWTTINVVGGQTVTGFGFSPDFVFHLFSNVDYVGPGSSPGAGIGTGFMNSLGQQASVAFYVKDNVNPSVTDSSQRTDAFSDNPAGGHTAALAQMEADGFTANFTFSGNSVPIASLGLKGVDSYIGGFSKTVGAAPAIQPITGVPFRAELVTLATFNFSPLGGAAAVSNGFGASDGVSSFATGVSAKPAVTPTVNSTLQRNGWAAAVLTSSGVLEAEAQLTSIDPAGFTLKWTTNSIGADLYTYFALKPTSSCGACGDGGPPDSGSPDAGSPDAGSPDAGRADAGAPDGGGADAGPQVSYVFTSATVSVRAGSCSPPLSIERRNAGGTPEAPNQTESMTLTASDQTARFFLDSACSQSVSTVSLLPSSASVALYFRDTRAGPLTIVALASVAEASQVETVIAEDPSVIALTTSPLSPSPGDCGGPVRFELDDQYGNPAGALPTELVLSSTATGVSFYADDACQQRVDRVTLSLGAVAGSVWVRGASAADGLLLFQSPGLTSASQPIAIASAHPLGVNCGCGHTAWAAPLTWVAATMVLSRLRRRRRAASES